MKWYILLFLMLLAHSAVSQTNVRFGVIITEIMADPSPQVGLPAAEFIELYNATKDSIDLHQWSIHAGNNKAIINKSIEVAPHHYIVLCSPGSVQLFDSIVPAIGISGFPSLDNDGTLIQLADPHANTIHAVAYHKTWYRSVVKMNGGWSLEMVDISKPCLSAANWKGSNHSSGGTPGYSNAVSAVINDDEPPRLLRAYSIDSISVMAIFNEALDDHDASQPSAYSISNGMIVVAAQPVSPLFDNVLLRLQQPLQKGVEYAVHCTALKDCSGNPIGAFGKTRVGLPVLPDTGEIVINEVLFNPSPGGSDYVELMNASKNIFDLRDVWLAGRNITNGLQDMVSCSAQPILFFPGEYFVFTIDTSFVLYNYLVTEPEHLIGLPDLPSLPDQQGSMVIITKDNRVIDELRYSEKWHFPLLNNKEGVALERMKVSQPTNDPSNWTSAASTAGFGTPTYKNSQVAVANANPGIVQVTPAIFSPNGDGSNDFAMIDYTLDRTGYIGTLTVFDMRGRPIRTLLANSSLSQSGTVRWDGLDHQLRLVAPGMYIVLFDLFNLSGLLKKYKAVVIVAGAFK